MPVGEICGTKERVLQQIMNTRSYEHLRHVISAYKEVSNKTIEEYIESSHLSHDLREAYLVICKILQNAPEFYAERLKEAIKGLGTDDDTLISIIVLRSEIDLRDIMDCYYRKFGVTLEEDVAGDTSGDYKHIMMTILTLPDDQGEEGNRAEEIVEEQADEVTLTGASPSEGEEEEDNQVLSEDPPEVKVEADKGNQETKEEIQQEVVEVEKTSGGEPEKEETEAEPEVSEGNESGQVDKEEIGDVEAAALTLGVSGG